MNDLNNKDWLKIIGSFLKIAFIFIVLFSIQSSDKRLSWAYFVSSITSPPSYGETGDWTPPPVPVLLSPANNSYRNTLGMIMDWTDVVDDISNPVYYIYESSHNFLFIPLTYQSGHLSTSEIPAPGTPDGIYYWRVKACDSDDNCSAWTDPWIVTVDNIAPTKPSWVRPAHNSFTRQSQNMLFDWTDSTDINLDGYEYENTKAGGSTWKSVDTCGLIIQSQFPNSQVGPGGTCINAPAATLSVDGIYTRRVRAKDKAGNYSNWSDEWTITRDTVQPNSYVNSFPVPATALTTFNVGVTAVDLSSGVKSIELFYRKDGGSWTSYGVFTSSPISFVSMGDGLYEFYSVAEDSSDDLTSADMAISSSGDNNIGNIETKSALVEASITVDTIVPLTTSLSVTGSWTKEVVEKITNGDFETGDLTNWVSAGDVQVMSSDSGTNPTFTVTPSDGSSYMARVGRDNTYVWENRLMGSFDAGAKSISLNYNFFSRDVYPYDDPGFFIRMNGQEIFRLSSKEVNPGDLNDSSAKNTGWQEFTYDLSQVIDSKINLAIYAGNTGDKLQNSWVYIDKVSTYFVSAPSHATYTLTGLDNLGGSGIDYYQYRVDSADITDPWLDGNVFQIIAGGTHQLEYRSVDKAGNLGPISLVKVITDDIAPSTITDLAVTASINTANLTWTAPGNDGTTGKASSYDIRYSTSNITDDLTFESATKIDKVPSPKSFGEVENFEIIGLNPSTTYYFAIKSSDEAPNTSTLSNVVSTTTSGGSAVNNGDIVINELMWMGSSQGTDDEWIELRNMTDRTIDLSNFSLYKYNGSSDILMLTIPSGKSISPKGYFLISNFDSINSRLKDGLTIDLVDSQVGLNENHLSITLYDSGSNLIDQAWDRSKPKEGIYQSGAKFYSMERTSVPGDGTLPLNWYTCIDEVSATEFFDGGADERGTPGAENRSENEPISPTEPSVEPPSITPTETPILENSPTPEITSVPENTPIPEADPTVTDSPTPTP